MYFISCRVSPLPTLSQYTRATNESRAGLWNDCAQRRLAGTILRLFAMKMCAINVILVTARRRESCRILWFPRLLRDRRGFEVDLGGDCGSGMRTDMSSMSLEDQQGAFGMLVACWFESRCFRPRQNSDFAGGLWLLLLIYSWCICQNTTPWRRGLCTTAKRRSNFWGCLQYMKSIAPEKETIKSIGNILLNQDPLGKWVNILCFVKQCDSCLFSFWVFVLNHHFIFWLFSCFILSFGFQVS